MGRPVTQPVYQEYLVGKFFSCELTILDRAEPFGYRLNAMPSKKAARTEAARLAVEWLRKTDLLNQPRNPKRRRMEDATAALVACEGAQAPLGEGKPAVVQLNGEFAS